MNHQLAAAVPGSTMAERLRCNHHGCDVRSPPEATTSELEGTTTCDYVHDYHWIV